MEGPIPKKTKESPKRANHKENIKFLNPLLLQEAYREHQVLEPPLVARSISNNERGGSLERMPSPEELSHIATTCLKIEIVCACCNVIDTLYL
jgi:hypothetical protein